MHYMSNLGRGVGVGGTKSQIVVGGVLTEVSRILIAVSQLDLLFLLEVQ